MEICDKWLILLFFPLLFYGKIQSIEMSKNEESFVTCSELLKEIESRYIDDMLKKYDLYSEGKGGRINDKIEKIDISFVVRRKMSLTEARELYIRASEHLLELINSDNKLRPYLCKYPFDIDHARISIASIQDNGGHFTDRSITFTSSSKNILYFYVQDILSGKLVNCCQEPYEDALKTVKEKPLPYDLRQHKAKPYEAEIDAFQMNFVEQMYKQRGLKCSDIGGDLSDGIKQVAFNFVLFKRASIAQARELLVQVTEDIVKQINANEKLRPYLKNYPFQPKDTQVRIYFWNKNRDFYQDGSVAGIYQKENEVHYSKQQLYGVPPGCRDFYITVPFHDESYDEAVKIVCPPKG